MANVLCPLTTSRIASNSRNLLSARRLINPYRCSRHGLGCITASANKLTIQPRSFPTDGVALLPTEANFEEERLIGYEADRYYPVRLGEVFESKFQVVAKLGFGMSSTVWLCRDLELSQLNICCLSFVLTKSQGRHIAHSQSLHYRRGQIPRIGNLAPPEISRRSWPSRPIALAHSIGRLSGPGTVWSSPMLRIPSSGYEPDSVAGLFR